MSVGFHAHVQSFLPRVCARRCLRAPRRAFLDFNGRRVFVERLPRANSAVVDVPEANDSEVPTADSPWWL